MEKQVIYSENRPWGSFHVLDEGPGFKVKRIVVNPGGRLSLQSHKHRGEHWTVVSGTATVTVDDRVIDLTRSESIDIPQGKRHRLENFGTEPVEIVEVQFGDYLGEDDIVRYDDAYNRV
jgi:mannose-6-phosphate isomerase-like protein (cupin superfamily)